MDWPHCRSLGESVTLTCSIEHRQKIEHQDQFHRVKSRQSQLYADAISRLHYVLSDFLVIAPVYVVQLECVIVHDFREVFVDWV